MALAEPPQHLITASILNLAIKGYLKIEEEAQDYVFGLFKSKKFIIHKLKEDNGELDNEERVLFSKLFYNQLDCGFVFLFL